MASMTRLPTAALPAWTELHALVMVATIVAVATRAPGTLCTVAAGISFGALTYLFRGSWTPDGRYGAANAVTAFRFLLAAGLLSEGVFSAETQALAAGLILLLDGIDGWLARRAGLVSEYGETLDKEVDAFFTLALCMALFATQRFGAWVLVPGALRYLFVLFIRLAGPPLRRERSTRWSRAIGATVLSGLTLSLLPVGGWAVAIAALVTFAVIGSFAASIWQLYHP